MIRNPDDPTAASFPNSTRTGTVEFAGTDTAVVAVDHDDVDGPEDPLTCNLTLLAAPTESIGTAWKFTLIAEPVGLRNWPSRTDTNDAGFTVPGIGPVESFQLNDATGSIRSAIFESVPES